MEDQNTSQKSVVPIENQQSKINVSQSRKKLPLLFVSAVIIVIIVSGGIFGWLSQKGTKDTFCTKEAKICPDGSSVGPTGPNCEFAPCPPDVKTSKTASSSSIIKTGRIHLFRNEPFVKLGLGVDKDKTYCLIGPLKDELWKMQGEVLTIKGNIEKDYFCGSDKKTGGETINVTSYADFSDWQTYRNEKYGFEIKYPCNLDCQKNPPLLQELNQITIPTTSNKDYHIIINITTGKKLQEIYESCSSRGECDGSYVYSNIVKNLNLALGSTCKIKNSNFPDMPCDIVNINQQKALKIYRKYGSPYAGPKIEYFVPRSSDNWLWIIIQLTSSEELRDLQDKASLPNNVKLQIEAADVVLDTLKFTDRNQATPTDIEGKYCGGIAGKLCPTGYNCQYNGTYPDASGKCIKQ